MGSVWNQSLRGALSRLLGRDVDTGAVWIVAVAACAVLAFAAWRSLGPDDRLGTLVIVQLFGLLVSPISWVHHWVWVVPMLLWLVYGPLAGRFGTWVVAACWTVVTLVGVPWVLSTYQASMWDIDRPAPLAWLGAVNVVGVLIVYLWMVVAPRVGTGESATAPPANRSDEPDPDRPR